MKRLLVLLFSSLLILVGCGKTVDVKEMYEVVSEDPAQQDTLNVEVATNEMYDESKLKKIIIDISSQYDHNKVNGIRFNIIDKDNKGYADAKIAFNKTGQNATGAKKVNIAEININ